MSKGSTGNGFSSLVPDCVVEKCYEHEGVIMAHLMPKRALDRVRQFKVKSDDFFIVTYPKSGTTWAEQISLLIKHDGDTSKLEGSHIMKMIPFIELCMDSKNPETAPLKIDEAEKMPSPRFMRTHCLPKFLPLDVSTDDPKGKVLYVARNPKDAAVSYYHFCHFIDALPSYESWDVFFEEFLAGRVPQGSWFENVLPWWKRRDHPNVLFLKYEDMKKDLPAAVKQIVEFMGKSFTADVIQKISDASTFKAMKKSPSANPDFLIKGEAAEGSRSFMRKGIVGDWKNYFTDDQNKRFDEFYNKEMAGSGLEMDFGPA
ncbi:sulfotransferase 1C2A [Strongylocentrotus purpuratus]|uniref:Sulfotransferase domain-containing protein n=1 Tax=Strongylocentrotus purpuratus TaxID=7668 RepID=A0A7M7RFD3_STRPU|nr:sulfotransferase 1C2A [Strongylocentrotus purpuratus]